MVPNLPDLKQTLPAGYVRLEDAVNLTKRSEKTVRNWAERKLIGKKKWKGLALYNASDLETQLAKEAEVQITARPAGPPMVAQMGGAIAAAVADQFSRIAPAIAEQFSSIAAPMGVNEVPLANKRYLTVAEAVAYTGLGEAYLRENCESWPIGPHRRLVFRRADLEQL